jgi:hypothetical protein
VALVAGERWIVVDRLTGERPHDYALRFQLAPGEAEVAGPLVRAPGLALVFDPAHRPALERGWVSPTYGVRVPAPRVRVRQAGRADATFVSVIAPTPDGQDPPRVRVLGRSSYALVGVGDDGEATDLVAWSERPGPLALGPLSAFGDAAWLRLSATGEPLAARVRGPWAGWEGSDAPSWWRKGPWLGLGEVGS